MINSEVIVNKFNFQPRLPKKIRDLTSSIASGDTSTRVGLRPARADTPIQFPRVKTTDFGHYINGLYHIV